MNRELFMTVHTEGTSRKPLMCTGEVELLEFFARRRACDDRDRELTWSDARTLTRGIMNALLAVAALWLAVARGLAGGYLLPQEAPRFTAPRRVAVTFH